MKLNRTAGELCAASWLFLEAQSGFAQGGLTPPGAPAPSMKSLDHFATTGIAINATARDCVFRDVSAANCTNIAIRAGEGAVLESCRVHDCGGTAGILTANAGTLSNCVAVGNSAGNAIQVGAGSALSNCAASNNTGTNAFSVGGGSTLMNCAATSNALSGTGILTGIGCSLSNCTAQNNAGTYGINAGAGSSLSRCTGSNNTGLYGILSATGSSFLDCSAAANTSSASTSGGFLTGSGSTVTNCNASLNQSTAGTLTATTGIGFALGGGSTIQNCVAMGILAMGSIFRPIPLPDPTPARTTALPVPPLESTPLRVTTGSKETS